MTHHCRCGLADRYLAMQVSEALVHQLAMAKKDCNMKKTIVMPRDAETGRIVSKEYAKSHPRTTTVEHRTVQRPSPAPKKK